MESIHLLIDFAVDDVALLRLPQEGMRRLREAVRAGGATILSEHVHQFQPGGYSGFLLLAQSHASIHTWPEEHLIAIDVFACGSVDVAAMLQCLREGFRPKAERVEQRRRGAHLQAPHSSVSRA